MIDCSSSSFCFSPCPFTLAAKKKKKSNRDWKNPMRDYLLTGRQKREERRERRTKTTMITRALAKESSRSERSLFGDEELKEPAIPIVELREPGFKDRVLYCMLRARVEVLSTKEIRCVLLPLDAPIDVLRGEANSEDEDLSDIDDKELKEILPDMQLALAKKGLLLQRSALCFTVRGPLRADFDDCLELDQGSDEPPQEATELVTFDSKATGCRYLVYAPLNPVLIVAKELPDGTYEAVIEDTCEIVEAAIEKVYEELASGPDDALMLALEKAESEMRKEGSNNNNKKNKKNKK